jgi:DNA-binding CsgD family transcriptional regulator
MEVLLNASAVRDKDGKILYSRSVYRDITERKQLQEMLLDQKRALEKKNIALSEILGQLEIEKKQIKNNVVANAENLLLPIIQKLKLTGEELKYVQILQKNLEELVSSFGSRLIENKVKLTTREIEICNMVKNGLTSKEIARLLVISLGTTKRHRSNIRRKLGIINTDVNLASFLSTE